MSVMTVSLRLAGITRAGWLAAGVVASGIAAVLTVLLATTPADAARPWVTAATVGALVVPYAWCGAGALRIGRARRHRLTVEPDALVIEHDALLGSPLVIARANIRSADADLRADDERRVAAARRRGGVVPPTFLDPSLPVVGAAPSVHARYGTAHAPNLVLHFHEPIVAPPVAWATRFLLRVSTGRFGRYRGPRGGRPMAGVRLTVDDPAPVVAALTQWGVLEPAPRNTRYLAPVRAADRRAAGRERLALFLVSSGVLVALIVARLVWR